MTIDSDSIRIVDLTKMLVPGQEDRRLEIRRGVIESDDTFMHEIDTMSHVGTHVEAPSHFYEDGKDVTEVPLETFMGRALLLDMSFVGAGGEIRGEHLDSAAADRLHPGDILVLRSAHAAGAAPGLTADAAHWMASRGINMLGIDHTISLGHTVEAVRLVHGILMGRDVPFLEVLANLDALSSDQFLLVAVPLRIAGLDSSPVRAFAVEMC